MLKTFVISIIILVALYAIYVSLPPLILTYREGFSDAKPTSTCYLHNVIDPDFCSSEYANMGKLQLFYAINELTNNPAKQQMLMRAYNTKKENDMFHIPCRYSLDKLKQLATDSNDPYSGDIPLKVLNDPSKKQKRGKTFTWANCFYDGDDIELEGVDEKNPAIYVEPKYNRVIFNNVEDTEKIKGIVCSQKNIGNFFSYESPCGRDGSSEDGCHFLRIKLSLIELDDKDPKIVVDNMRVVKWNGDTGRFEEVSNTNYVKQFFTMTYDTNVVRYIPAQKNHTFHVFSNDLCGGYTKEREDNVMFHIGMVGYDEIKITNAIRRVNIDRGGLPDTGKFYETNPSLTIDFRRANLLNLLENARTRLTGDKIKDYNSCGRRYRETQRRLTRMKMRRLINMNEANAFINNYNKKLSEIRKIVKQLRSYGNIYGRDKTGCDNNLDNSVALDLLRKRYYQCKATLEAKDLSTKELDAFISKAEEVLSKKQFHLSEKNKTELLKLITDADTPEINGNCMLKPAVRNLRRSRMIINNLTELIKNDEITDNVLYELDDLELVVDNTTLLKYASMDDCLYISVS